MQLITRCLCRKKWNDVWYRLIRFGYWSLSNFVFQFPKDKLIILVSLIFLDRRLIQYDLICSYYRKSKFKFDYSGLIQYEAPTLLLYTRYWKIHTTHAKHLRYSQSDSLKHFCYHDETIIFTIKLRFFITRVIFKLLINLAIRQTLKNQHAASETILIINEHNPIKTINSSLLLSTHLGSYNNRRHNLILPNPKKGYTTVSRSERVSAGSLKSIHESLFDRSELNAVGGQSGGNIFQGHTLAVVNVRPD